MKQHTWRLLDNAILETLEGRDMMSASPLGSVSFDNGTLTLNAGQKQATDMTVNFYKGDKSQLLARSGNAVKKVEASQVKEIVVNGGSGSENVYINPAIISPAVVNISTGNAGVLAGTDDTVNAGTGKNAIRLQGGGNTVNLGAGTNVVQASTVGNDTIYAGTGKTVLNGSMSDGTVVGASSKLTLINTHNYQFAKNPVTTTAPSHTVSTGPTTTASAGSGGNTATNANAPAAPTTSASTSTAGSTKTTTTTAGSTTTPTTTTTKVTTTAPTTTSKLTTTAPATTAKVTTATPVIGAGSAGVKVASSTATDATSPQPVISVLAGVHQTGLVVNVSGLQTTLGAGNVLGATFVWDFGDAHGQNNTITGFSAGHIYDTPGNYSITLTVTNVNGEVASTTQQVMVAASTRTAIYVDSVNGSDSNNGSASAPFQTLAKAVSKLGDNTEVLMKAGETFAVPASLGINNSNVVFGKYGSGADPVLSHTSGNGIGTFVTNDNSNGVTFENITFDSPYAATSITTAPKNGVSGIYVDGSNIAVRNCTFLNVDDAINENGNPTGVLIANNTAPSETGLRGYFVWGQGSQTTIIDNVVANSTIEHNIRMYNWNQFTIEGNNLTVHDGKGGIEMQYGSYGYVSGNTTTNGEIRTGPLGEWGEATTDTTSWVVITNNTINNTMMDIQPGSQHVMFENNVINLDNGALVNLHASDAYSSLDVQIKNNTGITNSTSGQFLYVGGAVDGVILQNNAWIAPNIIPGGYGAAPVYVNMSSLSDFTSIANNIWPDSAHLYSYANGGENYVADASDGYVTDAQWNSYSQVHDDQFENADISDLAGTYQLTAGSITAGSSMALAA